MAGAVDVSAYKDVVIVLGTAAVAVPLLAQLKVNPVLAYLLMGVLLGPHGLGALTAAVPALDWVSVSDPEKLAALGELGITFLLFIIGLELAPQRLWTMRRLVFGLGTLQVVITAAVLGMAAHAFGQSPAASLLIGSSLALSSTAIVIELLSRQNRMSLGTGRTSFAILLMQDLAVVPLLILVPILAPGASESLLTGLTLALGQSLLAVGLIIAVGYVILRPLFRLAGNSDSPDLFAGAVLLVAVGSGVATAAAGLSMALGAFIAGLLLAETEYRKAIEAVIEPAKGLLLGVFFFTVGAGLDVPAIVSHPLPIVAGVVALIVSKGIITAALVRAFGFNNTVAGRTAALIGPGGEFAFILLGQAVLQQIIAPADGSYLIAVASLSMALIPLLDATAKVLFPMRPSTAADPALAAEPLDSDAVTAIVIGHGRVGELVSAMLETHNVSHIVTEKRPDIVTSARKMSRPVYYGDAMTLSFLERCGLAKAKAVILTIHDWEATEAIARAIRDARPGVKIIARARDAEQAKKLYELGVADAVPETIEASLQLSEAVLMDLGLPAGPVIASIHEKRDEFRAALQAAAGRAGRPETRGLRSKSKAREKA